MSFLGSQSQPMIGKLPEGVSESPKCLSCGTPIRSGALGEVLDMALQGQICTKGGASVHGNATVSLGTLTGSECRVIKALL